MRELILTTFDWVPDGPRGFVRDIRVRWALEEAGLAYRVETVPFRDRKEVHFWQQPFGQVPWLSDGELSIFESGAILLHLAELSQALMPTDAKGKCEVTGWLFAALNSVEMASMPWALLMFAGEHDTAAWRRFDQLLEARLQRLEPVLKAREWVAGRFSVADILMADVLRLIDRFDRLKGHPGTKAYLARAMARPAFVKALNDQMAHFAAADA